MFEGTPWLVALHQKENEALAICILLFIWGGGAKQRTLQYLKNVSNSNVKRLASRSGSNGQIMFAWAPHSRTLSIPRWSRPEREIFQPWGCCRNFLCRGTQARGGGFCRNFFRHFWTSGSDVALPHFTVQVKEMDCCGHLLGSVR